MHAAQHRDAGLHVVSANHESLHIRLRKLELPPGVEILLGAWHRSTLVRRRRRGRQVPSQPYPFLVSSADMRSSPQGRCGKPQRQRRGFWRAKTDNNGGHCCLQRSSARLYCGVHLSMLVATRPSASARRLRRLALLATSCAARRGAERGRRGSFLGTATMLSFIRFPGGTNEGEHCGCA